MLAISCPLLQRLLTDAQAMAMVAEIDVPAAVEAEAPAVVEATAVEAAAPEVVETEPPAVVEAEPPAVVEGVPAGIVVFKLIGVGDGLVCGFAWQLKLLVFKVTVVWRKAISPAGHAPLHKVLRYETF